MSEKKVYNRDITLGLAALCIALIIALAGTVIYYQPTINNQVGQIRYLNSVIASKDNQTAGLNDQLSIWGNQIENLNKQISQLEVAESANVEIALGANDIQGNSTNSNEANHLWITGTATNVGQGTAYNAGLHIVAYSTDAVLVINMTIPITSATYQDGFVSGTTLTSMLGSTQSTYIEISIFHQGTIGSTDYSINAVWVNNS